MANSVYLKVSKDYLNEALEVSKSAMTNINNAYDCLFGVSGFKSEARRISDYWVQNYWQNHKNKSSVSEDAYRTTEKDKNGKTVTSFDQDGYDMAVELGAKEWVQVKVNEYNNKMVGMESNFGPSTKDEIQKIVSVFENIKSLITNFENTQFSLKEALDKIEGKVSEGGKFAVKGEIITTEEGNEIETYALYFSPDGTDEGMAKVGEAVNCAYTNIGMVSALINNTKGKVTEEEFLEYSKNAVKKIGDQNESYRQKGFFSVVSTENIGNMYEEAMGKEYDSATVASEYKDIAGYYLANDGDDLTVEVSDTGASGFDSMAMASAVTLAIASMGPGALPEELKTKEDDEEQKKGYSTSTGGKDTDPAEVFEGSGTGEAQIISPEPVLPPGTEPNPSLEEPEPELPPEEPEPEEPIPENPEPVTKEVTPEVAQGVRDSISKNGELNTPDEMNKIDLTSDDIDNQVRDEYYSDPSLAEKRIEAVNKYESMSSEERVSSLETLGYTTVVAAGLVADKAAGQAAYVIGIDEQNMANMSNALALQNGITNHNTRFDDGHGLSYFESGQAGIDMSPVTSEVQAARANLTTARGNYNAAVTTANDAITEANESKEKYNNTLTNIKKKKGDNPEDWSKEDVEEYNKVAEEYNTAVKNAEKAVEDAQSKKVVYEAEKANYDKAYEESVKKAQAGSQEAQDADDSDIINEMVPAEPDITEKVDDNGGFSTDPIPMVSPEELPSEQTPITPSQDVPTQGDSTQGSQLNPGEPVPDENNVYYEE